MRSIGINIVAYLDDTLIIAKTAEQAHQDVTKTANLLTELGFLVHPHKSVFKPTQEIEFLGFVIDSKKFHVSLPEAKKTDIKEACAGLANRTPSIREVAVVIGKLVAAFPAVQYGPLHYRELEKNKISALARHCGHFDRQMQLSKPAWKELEWWIQNIDTSVCELNKGTPTLCITSDASGLGWGATDGITEIGDRWNPHEILRAQNNEINYLELLASFLALQSFCKNLRQTHVLLRSDNTTAIAYINKMGGVRSPACNALAQTMWSWCERRQIWLSAVHIPGVQNEVADRKSRVFNDRHEWMLNKRIFTQLCSFFGTPVIDLFASKLNAQLRRYISWKPDPCAEAVDAFSITWHNTYFYAFPPFSLIGKCLRKIESDEADGLIIVPKWPTQPWFSKLLGLLVEEPVILPRIKDLLIQPSTGQCHPLTKHLVLLSCRLSGNVSKVKAFQKRQQKSYWLHGETQQNDSTMCTLNNGWIFAIQNILIHCKQLPRM